MFFTLALTATSCGTSRKAMNVSTSYTQDNVTAVAHDTTATHTMREQSSALTATDSTHHTEQQQQTDINEETIIELISELTDTAGRKSVTTSRTITRRGNKTVNTTSDTYTTQMVQELQALQYRLDSMQYVHSMMAQNHTEYNDSIRQIQERDTSVSGLSWWDLIKSYLAMAFIGFVIAAAIYTYNKTK